MITGAFDGRTAMSRWSLEYLAEHGDPLVKVRVSRRGERQLYDGNMVGTFDYRVMPLREAVERIAKPHDELWYVEHGRLERFPGLGADIGPLDVAPQKFRDKSLLWVCGPGTVNPLHWDTHHAALALVAGEKTFVIFPPEDSSKLTSFENRAIWRTAPLDLSAVGGERTLPEGTSAFSCTVRAGEVLFIPYRWWHFMECDAGSISVSWWWAPSLATHLKDSVRERAMQLLQRSFRAAEALGARVPSSSSP